MALNLAERMGWVMGEQMDMMMAKLKAVDLAVWMELVMEKQLEKNLAAQMNSEMVVRKDLAMVHLMVDWLSAVQKDLMLVLHWERQMDWVAAE
jgi:hypothetical protein